MCPESERSGEQLAGSANNCKSEIQTYQPITTANKCPQLGRRGEVGDSGSIPCLGETLCVGNAHISLEQDIS